MTLKADMLTDIADVFLDTDEFADEAVWVDSGDESHTINGIFDEESEQVNPADGMIETTAPQFECASADVSGASRGDSVTVSGTTYYIIAIQPDGTGMTTLILSKDTP